MSEPSSPADNQPPISPAPTPQPIVGTSSTTAPAVPQLIVHPLPATPMTNSNIMPNQMYQPPSQQQYIYPTSTPQNQGQKYDYAMAHPTLIDHESVWELGGRTPLHYLLAFGLSWTWWLMGFRVG